MDEPERALERGIASRMRLIAEQVKAWEDRDVREAISRGDRSISRRLYQHDLSKIADMLEGKHGQHRLDLAGAGAGRNPEAENIDRDFDLARRVQSLREAPMKVGKAISLVADQQAMGEKLVEAAYYRMRRFLNMSPEDQEFILMIKRMKARQGAKGS